MINQAAQKWLSHGLTWPYCCLLWGGPLLNYRSFRFKAFIFCFKTQWESTWMSNLMLERHYHVIESRANCSWCQSCLWVILQLNPITLKLDCITLYFCKHFLFVLIRKNKASFYEPTMPYAQVGSKMFAGISSKSWCHACPFFLWKVLAWCGTIISGITAMNQWRYFRSQDTGCMQMCPHLCDSYNPGVKLMLGDFNDKMQIPLVGLGASTPSL